MGSSCIDLSLSNIWQSWFKFKKGKKLSQELQHFNYYLEENLFTLYSELNDGNYKHQGYRRFIATDSKRREILVASVKDRVVHRLAYEYLIEIYDKTFDFDVWSCRKKKGLTKAIERAQKILNIYKKSFVWRADVKKFFDNINQQKLIDIILLKASDEKAITLFKEIIGSYYTSPKKGIPIGNLTSQIFANIYLNEFDRFIKIHIKPKAYLRYGDDFIIVSDNFIRLKDVRNRSIKFLSESLCLQINNRNDIIVKVKNGLKFLGAEIFTEGMRLNKKNQRKINSLLDHRNASSYRGLVKKYDKKKLRYFNWKIVEKIFKE
jgi:hypothetical protein